MWEPDVLLEMQYEDRVAPTLSDGDDWDLYTLGVCTDNPPEEEEEEEEG